MIDYETFHLIKRLKAEKQLSAKKIAEELRLDSRTVLNAIRRKNYQARKGGVRVSILDPYKYAIKSRLAQHEYSATQVFQYLQTEGYKGSYGLVRNYVRLLHPKRSPAYLTLKFEPGECAQVDWGEYGKVTVGNTTRKLSFFVMVLCYSRMMYLEFTLSQSSEHFLACHQNAFEFFGGVPQRIMIDNLKAGVTKHLIGEHAQLNPRYLDFANHYGFTISACNVRKANEKGRVENGVGYVKKNLLNGIGATEFYSIKHRAKDWLDTVANVRVHAATHKTPLSLFSDDKLALSKMPIVSYDVSSVHSMRASSQFRVTLDTNRYSVPAKYASKRVTVRASPEKLCIYSDGNLIGKHCRRYDRHQDIEDPEHPKALLAERKNARAQMLFSKFIAISPRAEEYYHKLAEKRFNPRLHIHKIVALSEIYGREAVANAIEDAFRFDAFSSEYITNILESRARILPDAGPLHISRNEDLLEIEIDEPDLSIYDYTNQSDF